MSVRYVLVKLEIEKENRMGYHISQDEAIIFIDKKHFPAMLKAMQGLKPGAWTDDTSKCTTVKDALDAWRWELSFDEKGNIDDIQFEGEKAGNEYGLFNVIAPYVKSGSYIQMHGEEGEIWRWIFNGKSCNEVDANIDFDSNREIVDAIIKHKKLIPLLMGIHPALDKRISKKIKKGA